MKPSSTPSIESHRATSGLSDRFAFGFTQVLRFCADTFFAKRYGHRAVVLETVAAVPGMVGATLTHLRCLRRMDDDKGWIRTLMDEAENERMHLMTFIAGGASRPVRARWWSCCAVGVLPLLLRPLPGLARARRTGWSATSRRRR